MRKGEGAIEQEEKGIERGLIVDERTKKLFDCVFDVTNYDCVRQRECVKWLELSGLAGFVYEHQIR